MGISNFTRPGLLFHDTFLYRINTFLYRVKTRIIEKSRECESAYCEDYLRKQLQLLAIFTTCSVIDIWQGSENALGSDFKYTRLLNRSGLRRVLNMPEYAEMSWHLFYLPIVIPCFLEYVVTYFSIVRN